MRWEDRFIDDQGAVCLVTVDGTDFEINEPKPFNKRWFSHKSNGPGVRYEIAICIQTGLIVWINGPFPCGEWTDIVIFRSALIHMLGRRPDGRHEMVEADNGYNGEGMHIRVRDEPRGISKIQYIAKARARARHEAVNARLKCFACLKLVFCHNLALHGRIFNAVAVVVNVAMANGFPTFHVIYPAPGNT